MLIHPEQFLRRIIKRRCPRKISGALKTLYAFSKNFLFLTKLYTVVIAYDHNRLMNGTRLLLLGVFWIAETPGNLEVNS